MKITLDSCIVAGYFVLIFIAGYFVSRRHRNKAAGEFITGGRTCTWYQTGLTLIAMAFDPTYMGIAGLGFLWGFYVLQWNAVHIWFTAWFAAMFLVPIYWRSRIVTTPEFLEKRFNVKCRAFFSLVMAVILIVTLSSGLYLGALLLEALLGWPLVTSVLFISAACGFYVILGGMRTVLSLDVYQGVFLLLTLAAVACMAVYRAGGLATFAAIQAEGNAGTRLSSLVPPSDWNAATRTFFPMQAVITWATVAGLSWLACNFGMAQRILASRTERDAQKGLLLLGVLATLVCAGSHLIGACMRVLRPDLLPAPDRAFMEVMLTMFPTGVRGILVAGMMAALLSTADGLLTSSSALFTQDIYLRFLRPAAGGDERKRVTRILEAIGLLTAIALVPLVMKSQSAMTFLQSFYGDVLGVVVALYIVGMFSRRAAPRAAFFAMISGTVLSVGLDVLTDLNFAYVGFFSFVYAYAATIGLSRFEAPIAPARLKDLTIHTLSDAKGPWVGLKAWRNLWKWALAMGAGWFGFCFVWESLVRRA